MNILFWNLNKKNLKENIFNIVQTHDIDIIILAETNFRLNELLLELNKNVVSFFPSHPLSRCEKIEIYTKFHYDFIKPVFESNRLTMRELNLPDKIKILLTGIHFIDKGNSSNDSQYEMASIIMSDIESAEENAGNDFNIIVGDFNMNPFEKGIIKANGFNATMSASIAKSRSRIIQEQQYKYLYNPMWSLYGDLHNEPVGSYFYKHAELINYQWNIFDQVLIRPDLIDNFEKGSLKILTDDGISSLVTDVGLPNSKDFSDHLPIIFTINLNKQ
jgi:exonuclease III